MSTLGRVVSAVIFAGLWTAVMLWWSNPDRGTANVVILSVIGVVLGVLWYWIFGWQQRSNG